MTVLDDYMDNFTACARCGAWVEAEKAVLGPVVLAVLFGRVFGV